TATAASVLLRKSAKLSSHSPLVQIFPGWYRFDFFAALRGRRRSIILWLDNLIGESADDSKGTAASGVNEAIDARRDLVGIAVPTTLSAAEYTPAGGVTTE